MEIRVGQKKYGVNFYGLNGVECSEDLISDCVFYNEEEEIYELEKNVTIDGIIDYLKEEVDNSTYEDDEYVELSIDGELVERYYGEDEDYFFNENEDEKDITLENLKKLVGKKVDETEFICCFENNSEDVIVSNTGIYSNFEGYGKCECVDIYENTEESEIYHCYISEDDILVDIG